MSDSPVIEKRVSGSAHWLWLGAVLLCCVVFAQHFFGVGFKKTIAIDINSIESDTGHAWKFKLPREHRTNAARYHLKVFEDGVAIGPSETSNKRVRQHGSGRYHIDKNGNVRLSASDNSSVAFNGRKYALEIPARVRPFQLAVAVVMLLGASLVGRKFGGFVDAKSQSKPQRFGLIALGVLALALAVRIWAMGTYAGYSDGGFSVVGIPYSDALAWTELAHSLRDGTGFQGMFAGQRPFYSVFMASVYRLFGESLDTGRAVNVACGALSVVFLFLLVARATHRWTIGFVAAASLLFAQQQLQDIQLLITEPMGLMLIIVGAYAWWAGLVTLNPWTLFAAGALIGLSNITRTFTMLGLPLFAFITLGVCLLQKLNWKRTVLVCAMFTVGASCVMAPWMIRQKLRYNTFSLSTAGSDLLYSAATDSPGWSKDLYDELQGEGLEREQLGEVHAFFSKRFAEKVKQDPGRYLKRLVSWVFEYMTHHEYGYPLTRLMVLLGGLLWAMRAWWKGRLVVGGVCLLGATGLAPLIGHLPSGLVLAASTALALWFGDRSLRLSIVVLLATLISGALMSAMIGNFGLNRTSPLTGWVYTAILFIALEATACRAIGGPNEVVDDAGLRTAGIWEGLPGGIAWSLITVSVFAAALTGFTGIVNGGNVATSSVELKPADQARVRDWVRKELPGAKGASDETFFVSVVRFEPYIAFLPGKKDASHWARPFLPRDYGRTVAFVRVLPGQAPGVGGSLMAVQFRCRIEDLPEDKVFVLVGVNNVDEDAPLGHDITMVEALSLIPFSHSQQAMVLDFADARMFPVTPEAATILVGSEQ